MNEHRKKNAKTFEGYFRPALVQLQWCSSILVLINTMFLVLGTPSWVKVFYGVFPVFVIGWVFYYFKRGRRQELTNIVQDNPIYDEVKRLREAVEELGSKLEPPSFIIREIGGDKVQIGDGGVTLQDGKLSASKEEV